MPTPSGSSPGNAACRRQLYLSQSAHSQHAPRCDRKCCRTTGQETQHLNSPPEGFSPRTHARVVLRCFSTNPKRPVQHGIRHVDKRDTSRTRRERGTALVSLTAVCLSKPSPASPLQPAPSGRCCSAVWFWAAVPERLRSDGNAETSGGAVGEAAGMSAGELNSALNFKCHCTKIGRYWMGSKLAQPLALSQNVCF